MKRVSDFVSGLGRDELLYVERMCQERYRPFSREIMLVLEKEGRDVFVNHIFYWLSKQDSFFFMCELRLVCSEWNRMLREITFIRIDDGYDCGVLVNNFPFIQSIRASSTVLTNFVEPCKRMKSLKVHQKPPTRYNEKRGSYSLEGWKSLTSLKLIDVRGQIKGIERLTSLTELRCREYAFCKPGDLMNLVNLTSLTIQGFPKHISSDKTYMTRLTKLSHLVSDYPGHFVGFSGTGRLDLDDPDDIQKHFNYFHENVKELILEGRWDKGVFSGKFFIIDEKYEEYEGVISEGKLITKTFLG